jgi:hypothetical protein
MVLLSFIPVSCSIGNLGLKTIDRIYKKPISLDEVLKQKESIDASENPAQKYVLTADLTKKLVLLQDVVVKDIIPSNDIDYRFCVLSESETPKGIVEFYIFSTDVDRISLLEKGKTRIRVLGDFRRFFSLLDATYVKIDIGDADIVILK